MNRKKLPETPDTLINSRWSNKNINSKKAPVLGDDDQGVPGPDNPCSRQRSRLGYAHVFNRPGQVSDPSNNQALNK